MTAVPKFEIETVYKVYDNRDGTCVEVGPDADCFDLIEIRYRGDDNKIGARITMEPAQAIEVLAALTRAIKDQAMREATK